MYKKYLAILIFIISATFHSFAYGNTDRILEYIGTTTINSDSSLLVKEEIRILVTGDQIKHGIYREFPAGINRDFEILEIKRDKQEEPFYIEGHGNKVRVYIGDKNELISPGIHIYELTYKTIHQIQFLDKYDKLYWNVTGNNWSFPIDSVTAKIILPSGALVKKNYAYTDYDGTKGQDYKTFNDGHAIIFSTTRPLLSNEGFTIELIWTKGFVERSSYIQANQDLLFPFAGLVLLTAYYLYFWYKVGRDPKAGTIVPFFSPPEGLSPAAIGYILYRGLEDEALEKAFTAELVNMAVKKHIKISDSNGIYTLEKISDDQSQLSIGEKIISSKLFTKKNKIILKESNKSLLRSVLKEFKNKIKSEFSKIYFLNNSQYIIPGVVISVVTIREMLIGILSGAKNDQEIIFSAFFFTVLSVIMSFLMVLTFKAWKEAKFTELNKIFSAIILTIVSWYFTPIALSYGENFIESTGNIECAILLFSVCFINVFFSFFLDAPTAKGRKVIDQIEGFKMYLFTTEKDRYETLHPPAITPKVFEKFLPYAIVFGIENKWSTTFENTVSNRIFNDHFPVWYTSNNYESCVSSVSEVCSGLNNAISSSTSSGSENSSSSGGGGGW